MFQVIVEGDSLCLKGKVLVPPVYRDRTVGALLNVKGTNCGDKGAPTTQRTTSRTFEICERRNSFLRHGSFSPSRAARSSESWQRRQDALLKEGSKAREGCQSQKGQAAAKGAAAPCLPPELRPGCRATLLA